MPRRTRRLAALHRVEAEVNCALSHAGDHDVSLRPPVTILARASSSDEFTSSTSAAILTCVEPVDFQCLLRAIVSSILTFFTYNKVLSIDQSWSRWEPLRRARCSPICSSSSTVRFNSYTF